MNRVILLIFAFRAVTCSPVTESPFGFNPVVEIPGFGTVRGDGMSKTLFTGQYFASFLGIPFAKEITQDRRFLPPEPLETLGDGIYEAVSSKPPCPQRSTVGIISDLAGSEKDCLALNVYTRELPSSTTGTSPNLPVIVFIHGGAFNSGRETIYLPEKILEEELILVTVQYRLGPLGFLCMHVDGAPGNAALYDQHVALQWVKNNIAAFGGDVSRITINGQSAGSVSSTLHMLSPVSQGLFSGLIAESGSAITNWAIDATPVEHGYEYSKYLNCSTAGNRSEIVECIRGKTADEIVTAFTTFQSDQRLDAQIGFGASTPCVQYVAPEGWDIFLPESPQTILETGSYTAVPGLFGATRTEGSFITGIMYVDFMEPQNLLDNTTFLTYGLPPMLMETMGITDTTDALSYSLFSSYVGDSNMGNITEMLPGLVDLMGVFFMKAACYHTASYNSLYQDSYWYSFDYSGTNSLWSSYFGDLDAVPHDVTHGDDLIYLYLPHLMFPLNDTEVILSKQMIKMWYNFAAYRNPTPDGVDNGDVTLTPWPKFQADGSPYLSIAGPNNLIVKKNYQLTWHDEADEYAAAARDEEIATLEPILSKQLHSKCASLEGDSSDSDDELAYHIVIGVVAVLLLIVIVILVVMIFQMRSLRRATTPPLSPASTADSKEYILPRVRH